MLPQVCPGTPACAFRMSNVLRMWHMRGVFQDMLLYGGVLLARAAGESAGGTFFAGEAVASANPPKLAHFSLTSYLVQHGDLYIDQVKAAVHHFFYYSRRFMQSYSEARVLRPSIKLPVIPSSRRSWCSTQICLFALAHKNSISSGDLIPTHSPATHSPVPRPPEFK